MAEEASEHDKQGFTAQSARELLTDKLGGTILFEKARA